MSQRGSRQVDGARDECAAREKREKREKRYLAYEPPRLTELGSFYELTRQQLKVSGNADLVNFQPSHV
jgi:hypothetical protein